MRRKQLYEMAGGTTVTKFVTWLLPTTCHPLNVMTLGADRQDVGPDYPTVSQKSDDDAVRVLVVEDDEVLAKALATGLRREGLAVDLALNGSDALASCDVNSYDVVVLDRDLPGTHGDEVCRTLVANKSLSRILMLTAASSLKERVEGLDLGADDYLPKPFEFPELLARIRAVARRPATHPATCFEHADLSLDPVRRVAVRAGRRLPLTTKELAVLECLLAADGRPVSAEELLDRVWDHATDPFTAAVKTTIRRLRAKLGEPPIIETIRESGYRIGGA